MGRYRRVALVAMVCAALPYLWVLWDLWGGTVNPLRAAEARIDPGSVIYDVQARALLHGHITLPSNSIGIEAFVHNGRTYSYFGLFPSLIRMPVLLFTHSLDGRLTGLSLLASWLVTAVFATLLLWRIRCVIRGDAALGWAEVASYGALLFSVLVGSVLISLASAPTVYAEDEAWGVALAVGSLFALLGVVERPSWGRVTACGILVLFTNLNRSTTGYACVLGTLLVAAWFGLGRAGPDRRRWAIPVALVALFALAVGCLIDFIKFDVLFGFPASEQLLYKVYGFAHINKGKHFSAHFIPSTVDAYLSPTDLRISRLFPFITSPELPSQLVAHTRLFNRGLTTSATASMPLLFVAGVWGAISTLGRHRPVVIRSLRLLLLTAAASAAAMLVYGTIYERFLADFMPLLILASMIGFVDVWRRMDGRRRPARTVAVAIIGLGAAFGFVANMGIAISPQDNWTQTQADHYVRAQQVVSDITGHPLAHNVVQANAFPQDAPIGQLFVMGDCQALYISDGEGSPFPYPAEVWRPVERAPHTPICRALAPGFPTGAVSTTVISPRSGATVSGSHVLVIASTPAQDSPAVGVSFLLSGGSLHGLSIMGAGIKFAYGWAISWDSGSVSPGTYQVRSVATFASGKNATSAPVSITVRRSAPTS